MLCKRRARNCPLCYQANSPMKLRDIIVGLDTDKNTVHSYVDHYYESAFKDKKPDVLVELGVQFGGSIKLWNEYFGCEIYALDIIEDKAFSEYCLKYPNIHYILERFPDIPEYDIFIDDGSHELCDQIAAIDLYLPKIKPGGLFIIEDVQSRYDLDALMKHLHPKHTYSFKDLRQIKKRYDDMLLIVNG